MDQSSSPPPLRLASHDRGVPTGLNDFFRTGWDTTVSVDVPENPQKDYHARRRAAISRHFPGDYLIIPNAVPVRRNSDCDYLFRPDSNFAWLTGYYEPESVCIIDAEGQSTLFVRPGHNNTDESFFRDRAYGELWTGRRPGLAELEHGLGITCRDLRDLSEVIGGIDPSTIRLTRDVNPRIDALISATNTNRDLELAIACNESRLIKDDWEIRQLQSAVDSTIAGFADVVRALPADRPSSERLVEGVFHLRARHDGSGTGYNTIAAGGEHACIIHWERNDGTIYPGDLVLIDAGVETPHWYTADITRTIPVSGRFTPVQRRVYNCVLQAQRAGIAVVKPGAQWWDIYQACMTVIVTHLDEWGILPMSVEEALHPDQEIYRRWTLHATGHMLGLDVHDCGRARAQHYTGGVLQAGQVITVEPGLYFQTDDLLVPSEYRGIGIRIEDDVLVTDTGSQVLSAALPSDPDELEAWMDNQRELGIGLPELHTNDVVNPPNPAAHSNEAPHSHI